MHGIFTESMFFTAYIDCSRVYPYTYYKTFTNIYFNIKKAALNKDLDHLPASIVKMTIPI